MGQFLGPEIHIMGERYSMERGIHLAPLHQPGHVGQLGAEVGDGQGDTSVQEQDGHSDQHGEGVRAEQQQYVFRNLTCEYL